MTTIEALPVDESFACSVPTIRRTSRRRRDDRPVEVREVARTARAVYFLADLKGSTDGRPYQARDAAGKVVG